MYDPPDLLIVCLKVVFSKSLLVLSQMQIVTKNCIFGTCFELYLYTICTCFLSNSIQHHNNYVYMQTCTIEVIIKIPYIVCNILCSMNEQ